MVDSTFAALIFNTYKPERTSCLHDYSCPEHWEDESCSSHQPDTSIHIGPEADEIADLIRTLDEEMIMRRVMTEKRICEIERHTEELKVELGRLKRGVRKLKHQVCEGKATQEEAAPYLASYRGAKLEIRQWLNRDEEWIRRSWELIELEREEQEERHFLWTHKEYRTLLQKSRRMWNGDVVRYDEYLQLRKVSLGKF